MPSTTQTPLPKVRDIIRALIKFPDDDEISYPWANLEDNYLWLSRSAHSLAVVAKCRQEIKKATAIKVWVPDFFCFGSLKFLLDTGVEIVFYTLNEDLNPDIINCEILAQSNKVDIFLHVHFFGAVIPTEHSAKFARDHGAWLVEDAAHVFRAVDGIGAFGDCILYSPHKHLPIPDGAILVIKNNGISNLGDDVKVMDAFCEITRTYIAKSQVSILSAYFWLAKRLIQKTGIRNSNYKIKFYPDYLMPSEKFAPKISALSKRLLLPLIENLDNIALCRSANANKWIDTMLWSSAGRLSSIVSVKNPPYLAGFSGSSFNKVKDMYESLSIRKVGLPLSSWPDLPPSVVNKNHKRANNLRKTQIFLPVHQSLSTAKIDKYGVRIIKKLTEMWTTKKLSLSEWDEYWRSCPTANLLQSWQYGEAKARSEGWKLDRLLVLDHDHNPVAIVQVLIKYIPFIGGIARINRGPILLKKHSPEKELGIIFGSLNMLIREARCNRWWFLSLAPEIHSSEIANNGLKALGFYRSKAQPWSSGLISLSLDEDTILMSLNGKWRNSMRKGIKLGVKVKKAQGSEASLKILMRSYSELQGVKGFDGISDDLLRSLFQQQGLLWDFNLYFAFKEDDQNGLPIGVLVSIRAGDTSTYIIGTSNDTGRSMQANSVLLWEAIVQAKRDGCSWYDIGGLNKSTPKGIASFKKGLNAEPYSLIGEWFKFISPFV